jgi:hypothetical protein
MMLSVRTLANILHIVVVQMHPKLFRGVVPDIDIVNGLGKRAFREKMAL